MMKEKNYHADDERNEGNVKLKKQQKKKKSCCGKGKKK